MKEKIRKLFGGIEMSWLRVIILAVAAGVLTAVISLIPGLKDTSFHDIAVNPEFWILCAVFIIVNCKKWWEASLKCFVFFLISQPLVYLLQVPFASLGWQLFTLYYGYWFKITLLTLPGAVIAYQLKRKDWLSVAVLAVANCYLAFMSAKYLTTAFTNSGRHILSAIFCLALALLFIWLFISKKAQRIVSVAVVAVVFVVSLVLANRVHTYEINLDEGNWSCSKYDESVFSVEIEDGKAKLKSIHDGNSFITFTNENGEAREYLVTVSGGNFWVDRMEG